MIIDVIDVIDDTFKQHSMKESTKELWKLAHYRE